MSPLSRINPTTTAAWSSLQRHADDIKQLHLKQLFETDPERFKKLHLERMGILYDYSKNRIDTKTVEFLLALAQEVGLKESMNSFQKGEVINETEKRKVLHTALRTPTAEAFLEEEKWASLVRAQMKKMVDSVRNGERTSYNGKAFTDIVNIGIGGSYLGPRFLHKALELKEAKLNLHFISNVDPQNLEAILKKLNLDTTLFIVVSKSFGTIETLSNAEVIRKKYLDLGLDSEQLSRHFLGITSNEEKAVKWGLDAQSLLSLPDWAGGRFSLWGSVGIGVALAYGMETFEAILNGASEMDKHFFSADFSENLPVLLGLLGIWNVNFLGCNNKTLVPYDNALQLFPSYIQQMIMESNGKSVDRNGQEINYSTSPIYWGEIGTDAQHSFFQLLHQGTVETLVEFLLPKKSLASEESLHKTLQYNCLAQSAALAFGADDTSNIDGNSSETWELSDFRKFPGNTPSSLIVYESLTPEMIGRLIALYEHQTFVQGALWNIFSFDQWGVELGKHLALDMQSGSYNASFDSSTAGLSSHLGIL